MTHSKISPSSGSSIDLCTETQRRLAVRAETVSGGDGGGCGGGGG